MEIQSIIVAAFMTLCGVASHVLKQIIQVRQTDETLHIGAYLTKYPYQMTLMLVGAIVAFIVLLEMNQLNMASAFMGGYMANSVADIVGDRSALASSLKK